MGMMTTTSKVSDFFLLRLFHLNNRLSPKGCAFLSGHIGHPDSTRPDLAKKHA